jgi:hypothetical protein
MVDAAVCSLSLRRMVDTATSRASLKGRIGYLVIS